MKMYTEEVEKSRESYEMLGLGIGLFQGGVNLFLNSVVLGTLYYGGYLMSEARLTPGDLMSFLVATQTIQRSLGQMSLVFGQAIKGRLVKYPDFLLPGSSVLKSPITRVRFRFHGSCLSKLFGHNF